MKKRFLAMMLVICMLAAVLPAGVSAAGSGSCGEDATWAFDEKTGTLTISGSGATDSYDRGGVQPWASFREKITTVKVGSGITVLGYDFCLGLTNLTTLELSEGLREICSGAFSGCTALTEVLLPDSLRYLGGNAFRGCNLEVAVIGGNLEQMGRAFTDCTKLQMVWFMGDAPENFDDEAFQDLVIYALYPDGNSTWNEYSMRQYGGSVAWIRYDPETMEPLPDTVYWSFDEQTGTLYIEGTGPAPGFQDGDQPWYDIKDQILHVVIGEGITAIGNYSFNRCFNLQTLTLPSTLMDIGWWAFGSCTQLQNVTFPKGLRTIDSCAFYDCNSLTEVVFPDSVVKINHSAFFRCEKLKKVTLPAGLETLGDGVFHECRKLQTVVMPQVPNLTEVGEDVFSLCESLTSMDFYTGSVIGESMFSYCTGLTQINVKDHVTEIRDWAFFGCDNVTRAIIGTGVRSIGENAMYSCDALEQVVFTGNAPMIGEDAFGFVTAECRYPENGANWTGEVFQDYGGTLKWIPYNSGVGIPEPEPDISGKCGDNVTWGFVERSGKLTLSGTGATWDYRDGGPDDWDSFRKRIRVIEVKPGVTDLGVSLFDCCTNAEQVILHEGLKTIGMFTFWQCRSLTELVIPESVTYIESAAIRDCSSLVRIKLPSHFTRIPDVLLRGTGFVTFTVPTHITELGGGCLERCENLEQVILHEGITAIGETTFAFNPKLKTVKWPSKVTKVEMGMFERSGLEELVLHAGVTEIGRYAFYECGSFRELWVLGDIKTVGEEAFTGCDNLTIYGRKGTKIEKYAKNNGIPFVVIDPAKDFADVPAGSFYEAPVAWAVENGITNGIADFTFGPNADCNRAQVVTFLWRAAGSPAPASSVNPFVDVEKGSFYEKAVLWAVEQGITNGIDATHFSPDQSCNRATVVTFLYRAFGAPAVENAVNPFTDVPDDAWYTTSVLWAVEQGITNGMSAELFGVSNICNRAQIVTFLCRAYR